MAFSVTLYELLGVASDASAQEISKAANAKLKLAHPDVASEELKADAHNRSVVLIEAKRVLTDAALRKEYDQSLARPSSIPLLCRAKHDWYATPSIDDFHTCGRVLVCRRCNDRRADRVHTLETKWHFYKEGSCDQARQCTRCKEFVNQLDLQSVMTVLEMALTKAPVPHFKWGEWRPVAGVCQERRSCERCGKKDVRSIAHTFGQWAWVDEQSSCDQRRVCLRCGLVEERQRHDFSIQRRSIETGRPVICCTTCGREQ